MANIIIHKNDKLGRTRSEQEENIRKEWGSTITDKQLDKLKYIERKAKDETGSSKNFITGINIDDFNTNHCDSSASSIRVGAGSRRYEMNYNRIFRGKEE